MSVNVELLRAVVPMAGLGGFGDGLLSSSPTLPAIAANGSRLEGMDPSSILWRFEMAMGTLIICHLWCQLL